MEELSDLVMAAALEERGAIVAYINDVLVGRLQDEPFASLHDHQATRAIHAWTMGLVAAIELGAHNRPEYIDRKPA